MLRRRKQDVLHELPSVTDTTQPLDLSDSQMRAYRAAIREHGRAGEKGMELALLTRLLGICDLESESKESCKIEQILSYLERIREQGEKAVIFSLRLEPLRELRQRISRRWGKDAARSLVGEMSREERDEAVVGFRTNSHVFALLASLRVGGEGLTLVEANHVLLFNQWWNPSANDQARDRVVRIGQTRDVRVYRFYCRNTIEESLGHILATKRDLFEATVERLANDESAVWSYILREIGMERLLTPQVEA